ncbi:hypothetical protein [Hylemonella gracilis]|uniref:Uncharacterized protein n=1 Tax=Hylemonella gracilis ATCC 19624 TaxID=887062 RepID=F3KTS2_9BURK|nr:hypothetical protein [Hylemonella gracilis]EGI76951.1 hypothetical protein HGR_09264 [Hylemonella gracilis ATCC 19624]
MKRTRILLVWALAAALGVGLMAHARAAAPARKVAVLVYAPPALPAAHTRIAQTRLEQILADNGLTVLDREQADKLKQGWGRLQDPGALITAEEFVANASKYALDGVYRVYLDTGVVRGVAGLYSATALSDIRYVGEDAQVRAAASPPMGVKGLPPSDGLTESAAVSNAVQRAVDATAQALGLQVLDYTNPRLFSVRLQAVPTVGADYRAEPRPAPLSAADPALKRVKLADGDWLSEEITCAQPSPDGKMVAVGGYIRKTQLLGGRPQRTYGSTVHVLDLGADKEVATFVSAPVSDRTRDEQGGGKVLDCLFLSGWRYVAAITQSKLFLWDTERGAVMSEITFDRAYELARLEHGRAGDQDFLSFSFQGLTTGSGRVSYRITRE